jgi:hypothetical protein
MSGAINWLNHTTSQLLHYLHGFMFSSHIIWLVLTDFAFLRSDVHCQALCTCLQAIETNNPDLLTQLNGLLVIIVYLSIVNCDFNEWSFFVY